MYQAEIAAADPQTGAIQRLVELGRAESGAPQCNAGNRSLSAERRVIVVAGIDCGANPPNGRDIVPVEAWVRAFLLNPIASDDKDLFVEILGDATEGPGGTTRFHDVVRLYR
jgi:hypothetical protein